MIKNRAVSRFFSKNMPSLSLGRLALAFAVASIMWFTANYKSDLEKELEIPINYLNLSDNLVISNKPNLPRYAKLRIKGTRSQVSGVAKTNAAINIDMENEGTGVFRRQVSPESISLPRNVKIIRISPREIIFDIDTILEKFVSVKPVIGRPGSGYRIDNKPQVKPSAAKIKGPKKIIQDIKEILTSPISIDKEKSGFSIDVGLVSPDSRVELSNIKTVKVTVNISELNIEKSFRDLKVEVHNAPKTGTFRVKPDKAKIKFDGPESIINSLHSEDIIIFLDASNAGKLPAGGEAVYRLRSTYPYDDKIQVIEITPKNAKIIREETEK